MGGYPTYVGRYSSLIPGAGYTRGRRIAMQLTISLKREPGHLIQDAREDASPIPGRN